MALPYGRAIALANRLFPTLNKPRGLNYTFKLSAGNTTEQSVQYQTAGLEWITGIFINNSQNTFGFTFTFKETGQVLYCPPQSQALFPLLGPVGGDNATFVGSSAGGVDVPVIFLNFEPQSTVWSILAPGVITNVVPVSGTINTQPINSTLFDISGTIAAGGVSQVLNAANSSRRRIIVNNPATIAGQGIGNLESIFINFGANATLIGGGSIEIVPGGIFDNGDGPIGGQNITITAATTGHIFTAKVIYN